MAELPCGTPQKEDRLRIKDKTEKRQKTEWVSKGIPLSRSTRLLLSFIARWTYNLFYGFFFIHLIIRMKAIGYM